MCGKASVSHLSWQQVYAWATSLTPPATLPNDPETRINISPSRLRRKAEPDSMVWETLPVIWNEAGVDQPGAAIWPYLPHWSRGALPTTRDGRLLSTANARLREDADTPGAEPFAPTFMEAWRKGLRMLVVVSWFYEFDARVKPQVPWAVFSLERPFWVLAALASWTRDASGARVPSVAVVTVAPNRVLQSVGHHRSPAILRDPAEAHAWLHATPAEARALLRPHPDETMGVEAVPMGIKIPGNQQLELPAALQRRG